MKNNWVSHLAISNIKKHRKRNIFSIIALTIGLTSSFLIIGFAMNAEQSIKKECYNQLDYGSLTISKENKTESKNGGLSIIRNTRPSLQEMQSLKPYLDNYEVDISFDAILPCSPKITYLKNELKNFTFDPIYSFFDKYIDRSLLIEGRFPNGDHINEVVINENAYEELNKINKKTSLNQEINIYQESESTYYFDDEDILAINDYFVFDRKVVIVGVVKDLKFLSTPKIYYSYVGLKNYLSTIYLNNLSKAFNKDISWLDRIDESSGSDYISSYSYRLFLKDYKDSNKVASDIKNTPSPFALNSSSEVRSEALSNLISAATTGMELFLVIALVGTALIMGIISFSFYSEERKNIAILSCLGANMDSINDIYCQENILIGGLSFLISIILAPLLQLVVNLIVNKLTGFIDIVQIPFRYFIGIPFALPILIFVGTMVVCLLSTLLPILFSKKISLKEELKDE